MTAARKILLGVAGVAGVYYVLSRRSTVEPSLLASPQRILVMGDSLAVGMMPTFASLATQGGHELLGKSCPIGSSGGASGCSAIVGASTTQWSRENWLEPTLTRARPTLVLISLGTNDFKGGPSISNSLRLSASSIVDQIKKAGAVPVWIDPLKMPFADSAGARDAWKSSGAVVFDSSQLQFRRAADGIHLTPDGYRSWAESIWQWLLDPSGANDG